MGDTLLKIRNLIASPNFSERIFSLLEIRLNQLLFPGKPTTQHIQSYEELIISVSWVNEELSSLLKPNSEADKAFREVESNIRNIDAKRQLPFPIYYNADITLGRLCYALTRSLKPDFIVETGVGYGVTSSLILLALEKNNLGRLISIDLHPLSDIGGEFVGIAIPDNLRHRWKLERGSSRRFLKNVISQEAGTGIFVHDSANVYTLQKWEFSAIWEKLIPGGAAVFNNINKKFLRYVQSVPDAQVFAHWQVDKPSCVTGSVVKINRTGIS